MLLFPTTPPTPETPRKRFQVHTVLFFLNIEVYLLSTV